MKIKITNLTRWSTSDLRRLYAAALRQAGAKPGTVAQLTVAYRRGGFIVGGECYRGSHARPGSARITLPRPKADAALVQSVRPGNQLRDEVARVMHHEALHGVGARHSDMTEEQRFASQPVPWAAELPLRLEEERVPDRAAALRDRLEHSRSMLRRAETRAKRAATILKKWRRRVALLERRTT